MAAARTPVSRRFHTLQHHQKVYRQGQTGPESGLEIPIVLSFFDGPGQARGATSCVERLRMSDHFAHHGSNGLFEGRGVSSDGVEPRFQLRNLPQLFGCRRAQEDFPIIGG